MEATLFNHPESKTMLFARLESIDLNDLFSHGSTVKIPGIANESSYIIPGKLYP